MTPVITKTASSSGSWLALGLRRRRKSMPLFAILRLLHAKLWMGSSPFHPFRLSASTTMHCLWTKLSSSGSWLALGLRRRRKSMPLFAILRLLHAKLWMGSSSFHPFRLSASTTKNTTRIVSLLRLCTSRSLFLVLSLSSVLCCQWLMVYGLCWLMMLGGWWWLNGVVFVDSNVGWWIFVYWYGDSAGVWLGYSLER